MTKKILVFGLGFLIILLSIYLGIACFFREGFLPGTWINEVYATGKSIQEINEELQKDFSYSQIVVTDWEGNEEILEIPEDSIAVDYSTSLFSLLSLQNPFLWPFHLLNGHIADFKGTITILNPQALQDRMEQLTSFQKGIRDEKQCGVAIRKSSEGYVLADSMCHLLEGESAKSLIMEAIKRQEDIVSLQDAYYDLPYTASMQRTLNRWEELERYLNQLYVYDMGEKAEEQVTISRKWLSDFLIADGDDFKRQEDGSLVFDEEKVASFLANLASRYDTLHKTREFQTTEGDIIQVPPGTYGNQIDQQKEFAYLMTALAEGRAEVHKPLYLKEEKQRGLNDIGNTYVEIDLTNQHLYYYRDGRLHSDTDIVTGNMARRRDTPSGVYDVYYMQRNRTLRGPGYASFVKYWMAVYKGVGIHDASWRKEFGGDIYLKDGSHGCINTPTDFAAQLYENIEIGTPVILYYR